jgi:tetratricopeptide (TPR) repeat protein
MQTKSAKTGSRFNVARLAKFGLVLIISASAMAQQPAPVEAPAASPQPAPAELAQSRKLLQQGKIDEAIAALQTLAGRDPTSKGLDLELGTAYYRKSDFPKAIEYLKKATAADPANQEAVQMLGMSYYAGGHPADAIPLLEKVQGWIPRANVDGYYILGICHIQTRNYDQARSAFGKMFDVPGDSAAAYLLNARNLLTHD